MDKSNPTTQATNKSSGSEKTYTRFDLSQRIEHVVFLISFTLLGITGLAQKFSSSLYGQGIIAALGGIEMTRLIHRMNAVIMMIVSIYHIVSLLYRIYVLRASFSMVPIIEDFKHLLQDIGYNLGLRKHKAYYGRYNYAEKVEYLAVVWGTIIMGITGFMMWNPISTAQWFPGQIIPAAKAAHGGEAILAVLAIVIWHFYHVHIRHFNKSMFTGKLTREEMLHEHPAELAAMDSGQASDRPRPEVIRRRQHIFFPIALILTTAFSFGAYKFVNFEETAITTIPPGETVAVFVPITPTPRPTDTAAPTPVLGDGVIADSWQGYYEGLFRNRCSTCHGFTKVGGISLATYQDALAGGDNGPGIVPGDPDASVIVRVQSAGGHPGQLTIDELNAVINWILASAPEQ